MAQRAPIKLYRRTGGDLRNTVRLPIIERVRREINDLGLLGAKLFGRSGPNKLRNNRTIVSLGKGNVSVQQPSYVVPQVVAETPTTPTTTLFPEVDRRDGTQNEEIIQVAVVATDWFDYWEKKDAGIDVLEPGTIVPTTTTVVEPAPIIQSTTDTSGSMDLGTILGGVQTAVDIYGQYKAINQPQTVAYQPALQTLPEVGGSIIDFFTDPTTGAVVPVRKKKPCRRRRKRLATKSDLGDLAALKAILGNGEAFKAWIATHSR